MMTTTVPTERPRDPSVPHYKTLRAASTWRGNLRADISVRDFVVTTGEPAKAGGDDSAPTPMEVVLAGMEGCLTVVVETIAAERELALRSLDITSEAVMDIRGFEGVPGVRPFYETVETNIAIDIDLSEQDLANFATDSEARCPALTLFRAAGVSVTTHWRIAK